MGIRRKCLIQIVNGIIIILFYSAGIRDACCLEKKSLSRLGPENFNIRCQYFTFTLKVGKISPQFATQDLHLKNLRQLD